MNQICPNETDQNLQHRRLTRRISQFMALDVCFFNQRRSLQVCRFVRAGTPSITYITTIPASSMQHSRSTMRGLNIHICPPTARAVSLETFALRRIAKLRGKTSRLFLVFGKCPSTSPHLGEILIRHFFSLRQAGFH